MNSVKTLLDTDVLSELMRPQPEESVSRFVSGIETPFVSAALCFIESMTPYPLSSMK